MKRNTGFTLIELLVVIAIIGILSSIVLASLNSARAKGTDAAIKSTLAQIRTQASLYYDNNGQKYIPSGTTGTSCSTALSVFVDPTIANQINSAKVNAGADPLCAVSTDAWVVSSPLKTAGNWCVDSTGVATSTTADTVNIKCN